MYFLQDNNFTDESQATRRYPIPHPSFHRHHFITPSSFHHQPPILQPRLNPLPPTLPPLRCQTPRHPPRNHITDRHIRDHRINPTRTREHTGIRNVQALCAPYLPLRINNTRRLSSAPFLGGRHATGAHLVGAPKTCVSGRDADLFDGGEPGFEGGVVDSVVVGGG